MRMSALFAALCFSATASAQSLGVSGSCPGPMDFAISGVTGGGSYALISAAGPGSATIPGGPCAGMATGLSPSGFALRGIHSADAAGNGWLSPSIPGAACSSSVQVLDVSTCTLSDAVPLNAIPGDCASHDQWTPVTCTIGSWVWSSDRTYTSIDSAEAEGVLWTGCTHSGDGNDDGMCSLDGMGWVSTESSVMAGCNETWYHLGGTYTGNCGGHDGDIVRHLVTDPMGCYDY
jgi:hypothetical protein